MLVNKLLTCADVYKVLERNNLSKSKNTSTENDFKNKKNRNNFPDKKIA